MKNCVLLMSASKAQMQSQEKSKVPRSVGDQGLPESLKDADELAGERRQVVDDQGQGPRGRPLKLLRLNGGDGGAAAGLVGDPVERVLGGVATVATE